MACAISQDIDQLQRPTDCLVFLFKVHGFSNIFSKRETTFVTRLLPWMMLPKSALLRANSFL